MAVVEDLLALTSEIVSAHVSRNSVSAAELPTLITSVHGALSGLGAYEPASKPEVSETAGAVTVRKSLASRDHIISMIDGKPYKTLTRHLAKYGFTAESYRERFGLKPDYPMTAPAYSERKREMALTLGLGCKAEPVSAPRPEPVTEQPKAKCGRPRKATAAVMDAEAVPEAQPVPAAEKAKRGWPAKLKPTYAAD
jgi:predicted transcriptional regulator